MCARRLSLRRPALQQIVQPKGVTTSFTSLSCLQALRLLVLEAAYASDKPQTNSALKPKALNVVPLQCSLLLVDTASSVEGVCYPVL